ncbi:MAG: hypothetical protein WCO49_19795, partial [Nostocales cyanobacterium ELA608]
IAKGGHALFFALGTACLSLGLRITPRLLRALVFCTIRTVEEGIDYMDKSLALHHVSFLHQEHFWRSTALADNNVSILHEGFMQNFPPFWPMPMALQVFADSHTLNLIPLCCYPCAERGLLLMKMEGYTLNPPLLMMRTTRFRFVLLVLHSWDHIDLMIDPAQLHLLGDDEAWSGKCVFAYEELPKGIQEQLCASVAEVGYTEALFLQS